MNVGKSSPFLAAAALFTLMVGTASADTAKPIAVTSTAVQSRLMPAQPVVVLLGTASLEEYGHSEPAGRTEITRTSLAQRPRDRTPRAGGTAHS